MTEQYYFKVNGMKCAGCVESVEKALKKLSGVESVEADLDSSMVVVKATASGRAIGDTIDEAGFNAILIPE